MQADWRQRAQDAGGALRCVGSGMRLFVHGAAATPTPLLEALARRSDLSDVTLYHMHTDGPAPFAGPEHANRFFSVSLFTGPALRAAINEAAPTSCPSSSRTSPRC